MSIDDAATPPKKAKELPPPRDQPPRSCRKRKEESPVAQKAARRRRIVTLKLNVPPAGSVKPEVKPEVKPGVRTPDVKPEPKASGGASGGARARSRGGQPGPRGMYARRPLIPQIDVTGDDSDGTPRLRAARMVGGARTRIVWEKKGIRKRNYGRFQGVGFHSRVIRAGRCARRPPPPKTLPMAASSSRLTSA